MLKIDDAHNKFRIETDVATNLIVTVDNIVVYNGTIQPNQVFNRVLCRKIKLYHGTFYKALEEKQVENMFDVKVIENGNIVHNQKYRVPK